MNERKQKEKERFEQRKALHSGTLTVFKECPRKFESGLHKKMAKLEKLYDRYAKCPLRLARVLKQAEALDKRIKKGV